MRLRRRRTPVTGGLFLRVTGGCDHCDAWSDYIDHGAGIFSALVIQHDPTCPYLAALTEQP